MAVNAENSNGEAARPSRVVGVTVFFDPDSPDFTVWTEVAAGEKPPVGIVMMMLDEALRQFDAARRLATGKELARQMADEKRTQELTRGVARGMHS